MKYGGVMLFLSTREFPHTLRGQTGSSQSKRRRGSAAPSRRSV